MKKQFTQHESCAFPFTFIIFYFKMSTFSNEIPQTDPTDIYPVKWIEFNHELLPILLQNANGPCPLLALANVLFLRKKVTTVLSKQEINRRDFSSRSDVDRTKLVLQPVD